MTSVSAGHIILRECVCVYVLRDIYIYIYIHTYIYIYIYIYIYREREREREREYSKKHMSVNHYNTAKFTANRLRCKYYEMKEIDYIIDSERELSRLCRRSLWRKLSGHVRLW